MPDHPVYNLLSIIRRGRNMRYGSAVLLLAIALIPVGVAAQNPTGSASSDDPVTLGRRLFQQNCSVCHTQTTLTNPMYGPVLHRDIVNGNEDLMRDYIARGSVKMPGFRYGLKPSEIDAIVQYLKTVPKPAPRGPQKGEGPVD
jgi:mono/diheme cytochrome c family protein